jgi:hypothetical protein
MLVIAFTGLIIEAKRTNTVNDVSEAIAEVVRAAANRGWNSPDHDLGEATLPQDPPFPKQQRCSHVGILTNSRKQVNKSVRGSRIAAA